MGEKFIRIINKYMRMEQKPMNFGVNDPLNPAEIHTIEAIGRHDGPNVTELASVLGITKGGVSQMIAKLSAKGLVAKTKDGLNDKEVKLRLTPEGLKAYRSHENMHMSLYADLLSSMEGMTPDELERITQILDKMETGMDQYLNNN